jgi:hypothetical protein
MRSLVILAVGLFMTACYSDRPRVITPTQTTTPRPTLPTPGPQFTDRPDLGSPATITVGQRIEAAVQPTDPACFTNWDASGGCRQFVLVAPEDGGLTATLTWSAGPDMDLFLLPTAGSAIWDPSAKLTVAVKTGQTIGIVVMSYSAPQNFALDTKIEP